MAPIGLDELMDQQAAIQRKGATADRLGGATTAGWEDLATVACFMWWGSGFIATRIGSKHVKPEETVDLDTGGMVMPEGTDITARDRISQILNEDGSVRAEGPLEILAVAPFQGLTEVTFRRAS